MIAFLAAIEYLLSAVVADRIIGGKHRPFAVVTTHGAANITSEMAGYLAMPALAALLMLTA